MKPPSSSSPSKRKFSSSSSFSFYLIAISFILFIGILYGEDFSCIIRRSIHQQALENTEEVQEDSVPTQDENVEFPFAVGRTDRKCNIFEGKWVYDEAARPLYKEDDCPYIQPQLQCLKYGRPDTGYQHWRWQPHGCNLPSVNATFMLEMLRNKRMLFAGDSLNRGQFISMVCILHRAIPEDRKSFKSIDSLTIFSAMDYNTTIEFYWAPFLVESNSDNAIVHRITDRIVRGRSINKHAKHWKGADIIIFSSYLWWMTGVPMKILTGPFSGDMTNIELMKTDDAYRVAMTRMVRWVEKNMDPNTTRVFFTTMSPTHEKSKEWGGDQNGNCYNETTPIEDPTYWGGGSRKPVMKVLKQVLDKSKVPFTVVNITQLSEYRKDGHTAIYKKQWNKLTEQQLAEPTSYADCVHWCLPGVQDTWNELLYSKLFYP